MTEITSKYADFEGLRAQAVALRRQGLSRRQIRDRLFVDVNYRGCLIIRVLQGACLYRRIEGWWSGLASDANARLHRGDQPGKV